MKFLETRKNVRKHRDIKQEADLGLLQHPRKSTL